MFDVQLRITSIDYEATIRTIWPQVLRKCRERESDNLLICLLNELGETSHPVLLGILNHLPEERRQELLCVCMDLYSGVLTGQVNKFLEKDQWGKSFTAGNISLKRGKEGLLLTIQQVTADVKTLLQDDSLQNQINQAAVSFLGDGILGKMARKHAGNILKTAAMMAPDELERAGISLMKREDVKARLLELLKRALSDRGIAAEVADLQIEPCREEGGESISAGPEKLVMPKELELAVIRALASYLKDNVK
ncbi:MAG: hypothetical protein Q4E86_14570 [Lachnospiraceae bacterium]|nr:hypothetical protein [Lachnospiraceae bacterium]